MSSAKQRCGLSAVLLCGVDWISFCWPWFNTTKILILFHGCYRLQRARNSAGRVRKSQLEENSGRKSTVVEWSGEDHASGFAKVTEGYHQRDEQEDLCGAKDLRRNGLWDPEVPSGPIYSHQNGRCWLLGWPMVTFFPSKYCVLG